MAKKEDSNVVVLRFPIATIKPKKWVPPELESENGDYPEVKERLEFVESAKRAARRALSSPPDESGR